MKTRIGPWAGSSCTAVCTSCSRWSSDGTAFPAVVPGSVSVLASLRVVIAFHVVEQLPGFLQVRLGILPHEIGHAANDPVAPGIEDLIAVFAAHDNLLGA